MIITHKSLIAPNSLREKLAQLMMIRIGSNLPPVKKVEDDLERVLQLLEECPIGGLIAFNGDRQRSPESFARLQDASATPLLIAADIERGVGQQLHGPELFPHAMAFNALGDRAASMVEEFARVTAIDARAAGLHINFAPVADVNVDPQNPIIATRAFGSEPNRVAELVSAFIRGSLSGGLLPTAKHFPGHGNTHEDSHHALPTVQGDIASLQSCELVPFRAAIAVDVPLIMSAHVRYPAWDDSGKPATLSPAILIELLRNELDYQGAVVSDSLLMEGVKSQCADEGSLAVEALLAGVDVLLDVAQPVETLAALETAVDSGKLPLERVEEAFGRLWHLKRLAFEVFSQQEPAGAVESPNILAAQVAEASIQFLSGKDSFAPFDPSEPTLVVFLRPHTSPLDPAEQPLAEAVLSRAKELAYFELGPQSPASQYDEALETADKVKQILVAVVVKPAAWHAFGLPVQQQEFVEALTSRHATILASLGVREVLEQFAHPRVKLCTYSDVPVAQHALALSLFQN